MHDLQTIIKQNSKPVNQRTPPGVVRELQIRTAKIPPKDQVTYGAK